MRALLVALISVLGLLPRVRLQNAAPYRSPSTSYPFVTNMDQEGDFILRWGFNEQEIWFQVQARTLGYVAFGISENGLMVPADIVVGYIRNGQVTFTDYHTTAYQQPVVDVSQDWRIDHGFEENGWTVLGFNRSLDTCDTAGDRPITKDTSRLIYSYDAIDPTDPRALFHHDKRGSKSVALLTRSPPPITLPADSQTVDFRIENYTIPSDSTTTFQCRVFDLSNVTDKYHMIKVEPVITEGRHINVHHIVLYRCRIRSFDEVMMLNGASYHCFVDAPDSLQHCREHVASFGHGGDDLYFPEDVGLPLGGPEEANVYVLAVHYDNADFAPGLVDSSGIRVTYTSQLRQHDGAFLTMGNIISPNWVQFIPPNMDNFVQRAYCSQRCIGYGYRGSLLTDTQWNVPMTVVGVQFHGHGLAKRMKLRHMTYYDRNRVRENPWVADDSNYDSESQSFRLTKDRPQIRYFDQLLLECTYDSTSRTRPTVGGWTTDDELCRSYVFYYPRKALEGCMSWSNYDQLRTPAGQQVNGSDVFSTLMGTDWSTDTVMKGNLERSLKESIEQAQCWSSKQTLSFGLDYFIQPEILRTFRKQRRDTCRPRPATRG